MATPECPLSRSIGGFSTISKFVAEKEKNNTISGAR
jgi:hypothetical protein